MPLYGIFWKMLSKHYRQILNLKKDRQELFLFYYTFYRAETETGFWKTLPALTRVSIWQVFINGNKKAANFRNWRMVKGNNCKDTLSDIDGEILQGTKLCNFLMTMHLPPFFKMTHKMKGDSYLSPRMQGRRQKHITSKSCSGLKSKVLNSLQDLHT